MLGPGDVLGDRYRLEEFVASGGMGQVFRATDRTLGRTVAVKVLLPGHVTNEEFGRRFRSEARIMASIGHPGVVGVYDYGETPEGTLFLVMAFVDGRPLGERIAAEGTLSVEETLGVVAQAADALHAAHEKGIIHRDVKPNNLLVGADGAVTLVDFGVARSESVTAVTKVSAVIGTALYMSPEQASGRPISPSADIYALGVVAYHCLTGTPPFTGNSPLEIAIKHLQDEPPPLPPTLPAPARALVERAMSKDPADRYPTAAALAAAARAALDGTVLDPAPAPGVRAAAPTTVIAAPDDEPAGRPVWVPIAATAAVIALVAGVILAVVALTRKVMDPDIPDAHTSPSTAATASPTAKAPANPNASHAPTPGASTAASSAPNTAPPSSPAPGTQPASSGPPATRTTTPPPPTTGPATPPASVEATVVIGGNGG